MSDFRFAFQDVQDGNRRAAIEELQRGKEPSFGAAWLAAVQSESLTKSMLDSAEAGDLIDPNFRLDGDATLAKAKEMGIPEEYLTPLAGAVSQRHADKMLDRIQQEMQARDTLAKAGWTGIGLSLLVGITDPVSLAATVIPGGQAGWATKGGILKAAAKGALAAGASNAAIEAALASTQLTRDPEDIFLAAVTGFALGGTVGGLAGMSAKTAQDLFYKTALRRVGAEAGQERVAPALTPTLTQEAGQVPLRPVNPEATFPAQVPAIERPFTGADARAEALAKHSAGFEAELKKEIGTVSKRELRAMREDLLQQTDEANKWIGLFGRVEGHAQADAARAKIAELTQKLSAVDASLRAADDLDWLRQGFVPQRFEKVVADEAAAILKMREVPPVKAAVRAAWLSQADDPIPTKPRPKFLAKEYVAKSGDEVEWDGRTGVERGRVIHESKTRTIIEDSNGNIREFRPLPVDTEEEGAKFLGGSIGSAQIGHIDAPATKMSSIKIGKWEIPLRFDAFSYFDRSGNPQIRKLASLLLDDPLGKRADKAADGSKIHIENRVAASEIAEMEFKRLAMEYTRAYHDAWDEFAKRAKLTVAEKIAQEREFRTLLSKITRDKTGTLAAQHPEAAKAASKMSALRNRQLKLMQEFGVEGADEVADNANYLNRRYKWDKIARMGADAEVRPHLERLFAEAILKARPEIDAVRAMAMGKTFLKRLRELQTDPKALGFLSDGGYKRLAAALRQSGMEDGEVDDLLGFVFNVAREKKGDTNAHPRLKHRMFLDESHTVKWTDAAGKEHFLSFDDLLENDILTLNDIYFKQTSGLIALARVGLRSKADYQALRQAAIDEGTRLGHKAEKINRQVEDLDRVVRHILGQPMYDGFRPSANTGLRILRNANVAMNLAQVGFAQIAEAGQVLALKTEMALRTNMDVYDRVQHQLRRGRPDASLVRDLKAMGAVAEESYISRPRLKEYEPDEAFLGRTDDVTAIAADRVLRASGMHWLTEFQRDSIAKMYTQRLLNIAVGAEKLDDKLKARLATNGLADEGLDAMLADFKKYVRVGDDGRSVVGVDYDDWEKHARKTFDAFRLAVHRESYRAIQEVTLGGAPLWMHSEVGKLLFQFRSFVMNAWVKQTLHGLAHFDAHAFAAWTFSMMFGSLAYSAQTYANFAHNQKELDRRLDPWEIAKSGFQRAGFSSLVPMAIDTTMQLLTGDQMFKFGRSSTLASGFVLGNPTVSLLNRVTGLTSAVGQSVFTSDHLWTQKEVGYATGLLPQIVGIRAGLDAFKQTFPRNNYLREGQPQ